MSRLFGCRAGARCTSWPRSKGKKKSNSKVCFERKARSEIVTSSDVARCSVVVARSSSLGRSARVSLLGRRRSRSSLGRRVARSDGRRRVARSVSSRCSQREFNSRNRPLKHRHRMKTGHCTGTRGTACKAVGGEVCSCRPDRCEVCSCRPGGFCWVGAVPERFWGLAGFSISF